MKNWGVLFWVAAAVLGLVCQSWAGSYMPKPPGPPPNDHNPFGGEVHWGPTNTTPYGGTLDWYGGAHDADIVICEDMITTTWVWVRSKLPGTQVDDPLDNPPEYVISKDYCEAYAYAYSSNGGVAASADNGLGFEETSEGGPFAVWAESKGTLYTRRLGGQEIPLYCTPSAIAMSNVWESNAYVYYKSQIIVPTINVTGTTRFETPTPAKLFLTGQQIKAALPVVQDQPPVLSRAWSTAAPDDQDTPDDPKVFESYSVNVDLVNQTSTGIKKMHTKAQIQAASFDFFTADKGSLIVKCDLVFGPAPAGSRYAGDPPFTYTAKANVIRSVRPAMTPAQRGTVTDGQVQLWPVPPLTPTMFVFGNPDTNQNGQTWENVTFNPSPFAQAGLGCFVQLITANREMFRNPNGNFFARFIYQRTKALDADFPYRPYPLPQILWNIANSSGTFVDSPKQPLNYDPSVSNPNDQGGTNWFSASANDSFETWAMFKPPQLDANHANTWIPMVKYTWSWNGNAEKVGGNWTLPTKGGGWLAEPAENKDHPVWNTFSPSPFNFVGAPL